jgi:hypothetical protein
VRWAATRRTPPVRRRITAPNLRPLRPVLVPGPRFEEAKLLVEYLIHIAEEFDHDPVGIVVINGDVVTDDVADRPPGQLDIVVREQIACPLDVRPIAHLERHVRYKGPGIAQKIHGVVVAAAAQEGEKVAAPVRHPESQLSFANNTTTTVASWPRQRSRRSELAYAISARIMNRLADSTAGTASTATRPTTTNTKTI